MPRRVAVDQQTAATHSLEREALGEPELGAHPVVGGIPGGERSLVRIQVRCVDVDEMEAAREQLDVGRRLVPEEPRARDPRAALGRDLGRDDDEFQAGHLEVAPDVAVPE